MGCGDVGVSALDFRSEGRCFEAQSLSTCCFFDKEPPLANLSLSTLVRETILSVASCYRNWVTLPPCKPPWLVCDLGADYMSRAGSVEWLALSAEVTAQPGIAWGGPARLRLNLEAVV